MVCCQCIAKLFYCCCCCCCRQTASDSTSDDPNAESDNRVGIATTNLTFENLQSPPTPFNQVNIASGNPKSVEDSHGCSQPDNRYTSAPRRSSRETEHYYLRPIEQKEPLIDGLRARRNAITLGEKIGQGNFAVVYRGILHPNVPVAVKKIKQNAMTSKEFFAEAKTMKSLDHGNLLRIYAVVTEEPLYLVTEYMKNGNLLDYLRNEGRDTRQSQHTYMAKQISDGMAYLESKKYIHRDLRAQNILVDDDWMRCKISDFGLARLIDEDVYNASTSTFPYKWTAPEALRFSRFTTKSDVWSFGILLTEIITNGAEPYPGMEKYVIGEKIPLGYTMPKPPECPDNWYDIMTRCWRLKSDQRPSFAELKDIFNGLHDANSKKTHVNPTFTKEDEDLPPPPNEK